MNHHLILGLRLTAMMDTVIRVPAVFIMDALIGNSSFSPKMLFADSPASLPEDLTNLADNDTKTLPFSDLSDVSFEVNNYWSLTAVLPYLLRLLGFILAFLVFLLPTERLIGTYKWLISVGALFGCYWTNNMFINRSGLLWDEEEKLLDENYLNFGTHFFLLCLFNFVFYCTHNGSRASSVQLVFSVLLLVPSLLNHDLVRCDKYYLNWLSLASTCLLAFYVLVNVVFSLHRFYVVLQQSMIMASLIVRHNGLPILLENEWLRLRVPSVLRLFWLIRFGEHLLFSKRYYLPNDTWSESRSVEDFVNASRRLLESGCETLVAVLGLTSVVSAITDYLCSNIQRFLLITDGEESSFGTVSAILFLILALQTGLTGLEPGKRFVRLYRNFCLLFTAILHFIHNIVGPILMSLSASRNRSVKQHGRALLVCLLLIVTPSLLLYYLWSTHTISTWLLAVTAFSIEVIIKVIISLLIYALFMIDAYRNTFWEKLDDYVYYVRATGNTIEFVFGIFLFFNGTWILIFEAGGTIRACLMCIHAYCNIWMQAKAGWKTFVRRRTAVNKINSFPEASEEQLRMLDDVCAICYQEMASARMTVCKHYFHALCLRKWLYIQDRCPMCHKALYEIESDSDSQDEGGGGGGLNPENLIPNNEHSQQGPNIIADD